MGGLECEAAFPRKSETCFLSLLGISISGWEAGEIVVMDRVQGYMDGPRLLRVRLGGLVPHSLGWNCALGVGD